MNAYYTGILFRGMNDKLGVPGIAREHEEGEWIEVSPVGVQCVTSACINVQDIKAFLTIASNLFTLEDIQEFEAILQTAKQKLAD